MANEEHLAKLLEGPDAWNRWREEHQSVSPELSGADLGGANLVGANLGSASLVKANLCGARLFLAELKRANLVRAKLIRATLIEADLFEASFRGADLFEANFSHASLVGADLVKANLAGAKLDGADLVGVDLGEANLAGAKLVGADLNDASLVGADLSRADLEQATLYETVFGATNLSDVKGLDTCKHFGPSTLDHRTLAKSGPLPLAFLRGCGLLDWQIEATKLNFGNLSNLEVDDIVYKIATLRYGQPIQFYSCFISYSTKDQDFAQRLHADLQNKGVRCWFAPHQIQAGKKIHEQIDEAIRLYDRLLLILSEDSMESEWVKTEISKARKRETREKRRMLFPVRLVAFETLRDWECFDADTGKDSAQEIREYFVPDFSKWKDHDSYQKSFDRLLNDLKAEAERADTATSRAD